MENLPKVNHQALVSSSPSLLLFLLPNFTIIEVSDSYAKATMTKREEIIGRGIFDVFTDNPDNLTADGVSNLKASLQYVVKNKQAHTMAIQRYDIQKPDGEFEKRYWSPLNSPVLDEHNKLIYIIHRVEDVTDYVQQQHEHNAREHFTENLIAKISDMEVELYKRSQEIQKLNLDLQKRIAEQTRSTQKAELSFKEIFEKSTDGIYVQDIDTGDYIEINDRAAELKGCSKEDLRLIPKQQFISDYPQYSLEKEWEYFTKAAQGEPQSFEWLGRKCDRTLTWYQVNLKKANINGNDRVIAFFHEINDRKKAEQEILDNLHLTIFQKKQLEDFCNIVSHNLRAPLVNISMLVDIMLKSDDLDEIKIFQNKLGKATSNLNEIFNHLVESLQIREDTEINKKKLDLDDYLSKTTDLLQAQIADTKATIRANFEACSSVYYPEKYLGSIFHNLISNALKYSNPARKPVIGLKTKKVGKNVILSVSDNGLGIDMEKHHDNLFKIRKVFHSMPDAKGFGLFITKNQIEAMGDSIWAESIPGQGTTFYIEFKNQII